MISRSIFHDSLEWNIIALGCIPVLVCVALAVKIAGFIKSYMFFSGLEGSADRSLLFGHLGILPAGGEERLTFGRKRLQECNGQYSCFWVGPLRPCVTIYHPNLMKLVFTSPGLKTRSFGSPYKLALPWIGEGLIVANGQTWSRARRLLTPAFHFGVLKDYVQIYNEATDRLFVKLDKFAETGESFDICPLMTLYSLEIFLKCSLGYDVDIQGPGHHPYLQATRELIGIWEERMRTPWLWPDLVFRRTARGKTFFKHCDFIHKFAENIIEKKREELKNGDTNRHSKFMDLIDMLLSARTDDGEPMTNSEIRNHVDTMMFGGHDTTASGISWALYALANNPESQERVQEEVDAIMESRGSTHILWQDLPNLEELTLCLKEATRLYPSVPFIQRRTGTDLDFNGQKIPSGTTINIAIIHLHRNPFIWEDPDDFRPERFKVENKASRDAFAFVPFAAGERNCIGQNFALNEEKTALGRIFQRYNVRLAKGSKPRRVARLTLKAEHGIWLTLQRR